MLRQINEKIEREENTIKILEERILDNKKKMFAPNILKRTYDVLGKEINKNKKRIEVCKIRLQAFKEISYIYKNLESGLL